MSCKIIISIQDLIGEVFKVLVDWGPEVGI